MNRREQRVRLFRHQRVSLLVSRKGELPALFAKFVA